MLLANYASDSGSDSESEAPAPTLPPPPKAAPRAAATSATSSAPLAKKKKPIKITLDLPKTAEDEDDKKRQHDGGSDEERDVKRPNVPKGGKGGSSLLGMLPAPKRKLPPSASSSVSKGSSLSVHKSMARAQLPAPPSKAADVDSDDEDEAQPGGGFLPPALAKKQQKMKKEESIDLFGLSSASAPKLATIPTPSLKPPTISSAPVAPDFVPPEPTANDPYPGYYQTPAGDWRAYSPEYYQTFFRAGQQEDADEDADDGRVGRHWDEFEKGQFKGQVYDIDANKGLIEARMEAERKEMAKKPKLGDDFVYQPKGQVKGLASQRHQLTALLNTAYTQREELEERIAANKKGMRGAGTKYGF